MYNNKRLLISATVLLGLTIRRTLSATQSTINVNPLLTKVPTTMSTYESGTHSVAYVTAPSEEIAKKIARGLVTQKLAACVNLIPKVVSIYTWQDKIEEDNEVLMMIKTRSSKIGALTQYVKANHPYEVCEVISLPIENGNEPYLDWISKNVPE